MIRKLCSFAVLTAFCIVAGAQVNDQAASTFKKSPVPVKRPSDGARLAPARVASLDDTQIWGYYTGNDIEELDGIGAGDAGEETYTVCYYVPGDGFLEGCSIQGVNMPILSKDHMKDFSVWLSSDGAKMISSQPVDASTFENYSFNAIPLDEPYAIPDTGLYIGVTFTISIAASTDDAYPLLCGGIAGEESFYIQNSNHKWVDYSSLGAFAMQLFIKGMELPAGHASFGELANYAVSTPGEEISVPVYIYSCSNETVNTVDYTAMVGGNKSTGRITLDTPIPAGFGHTANVIISYKAPEEYGDYALKLNIDKVNEADNAIINDTLELSGRVLLEIVPRKTVVEEYTGTTCPNCPRGLAGMEMLKDSRENFIGIAFHKYSKNDPMYIANYYPTQNLAKYGAPGCAVDRKFTSTDPYYGEGNGIAAVFDYCNAIAPEVAVTVSGEFDTESRTVSAQAEIQYLANNDKTYSIAYVLTADDLMGTSTYWKQSNNYYLNDPSDFDNDPYMSPFCKGGKYGQASSEGVIYSDVMIGSSYSSSGINNAPAITSKPEIGEKAGTSCSISLPTNDILLNAINWDKVYVVALVVASDGTIENAAKAQVTNFEAMEEALGIDSAQATAANSEEVARYNVSGQRITAPQKGLNIVKYSDGRIRKMTVK